MNVKTTTTAVAFGVIACSAWLWYRWRRRHKHRKEEINRVLFFPREKGIRNGDELERGHSFSVLVETLNCVQETLNVCVFTISHYELASVLIRAHQRGVIVRVLTDNEQMSSSGSQIERLRRAGIQVRNDNTSYFMHHKFVVIDQRCLVNGSLNWTTQAIYGNQENVTVTTNSELVHPFCEQFEYLWDLYDPVKLMCDPPSES